MTTDEALVRAMRVLTLSLSLSLSLVRSLARSPLTCARPPLPLLLLRARESTSPSGRRLVPVLGFNVGG